MPNKKRRHQEFSDGESGGESADSDYDPVDDKTISNKMKKELQEGPTGPFTLSNNTSQVVDLVKKLSQMT